MVDLFGKKKLEDRILELEAALARLEGERDDLSRTLEKRDEKIRKLTSSLQEASVALKAASRNAPISPPVSAAAAPPGSVSADGQEESDGLDGGEGPGELNQPGPAWAQKGTGRRLSPREMDQLLERLSSISSPREDLLTAYLSGPIPADAPLPSRLRDAAAAVGFLRGSIVLHCPQLFSLLLVPPFPIVDSRLEEAATFSLGPIREMLETPVLVLSAHAGESFLGVALGREGFIAEDLVKSSVIGKHSKGGWSQKRFERLREEEIKSHADEVGQALAALAVRYRPLVKYAVLAGDESLLRRISPVAGLPVLERRLARHNEKDLKALLDEVYGFVCYRID